MGVSVPALKQVYTTTAGLADLVLGFNGDAISGATFTDLPTTTFGELGRLMIPYGVYYYIGAGLSEEQQAAIGRIYAQIQNATPSAIAGTLRIDLHDQRDHYVYTAFERSLDGLTTSATDLAQQVVLPKVYKGGGYNYSWVLMARATAASQVFSYANSTLRMSLTVAELEE